MIAVGYSSIFSIFLLYLSVKRATGLLVFLYYFVLPSLNKAITSSLLRRGSKGFFSGGVDLLSNVSAGTELQATGKAREVHLAQRIDITNA